MSRLTNDQRRAISWAIEVAAERAYTHDADALRSILADYRAAHGSPSPSDVAIAAGRQNGLYSFERCGVRPTPIRPQLPVSIPVAASGSNGGEAVRIGLVPENVRNAWAVSVCAASTRSMSMNLDVARGVVDTIADDLEERAAAPSGDDQ